MITTMLVWQVVGARASHREPLGLLVHAPDSWVIEVHVDHVAWSWTPLHEAPLMSLHACIMRELSSVYLRIGQSKATVSRYPVRWYDLALLLLHLTEEERGGSLVIWTSKQRVDLSVSTGAHLGQLLIGGLIDDLDWDLLA